MCADSLVGTRLREYEITEEIGKGGMGTVYKARHIYLHKERAIKVIRSIYAEDAHLKERFIREAKILSELDHPNLVRLYEFGQLDENTFFMVQEYVHGESIYHRMRRVGRIPLQESIYMIRQAALGLGNAHRKSIVHRDISPDNLMLTRQDSGEEIVKVIDFGIAKPLMEGSPQFTATRAFIGKAEYCSPEQTGMLEHAPEIDHRTDIYSLAVTLYYMLIGKLPFYSPTPIGYLFKHATEQPTPILSHDGSSHIPLALDRLILKALMKDPAARHDSMEAFVAELDLVSEPDDFHLLFETGKQHYEKNQPHEAIAYWNRALQLSPEDENLKQWIRSAEHMGSTIIQAGSRSPHVPPPPLPLTSSHPSIAETIPTRSHSRIFLASGILLGLILIGAAIFIWQAIFGSQQEFELIDLAQAEPEAGQSNRPALLKPGNTYKILLQRDQKYMMKTILDPGQYRLIEDSRRADLRQSNLISTLTVLYPRRSGPEQLFRFNEVDIMFRKTHRFSLTAPGELELTLTNEHDDTEFFLTLVDASHTSVVPFAAEHRPIPLKLDELSSGMLDRYQSAFFRLDLPNGEYVAEWQFANAEQKRTNIAGYLALLDSDGGNQREISRMNEVDVSSQKTVPIRHRRDEAIILRLYNSMYAVDYSLKVRAAT